MADPRIIVIDDQNTFAHLYRSRADADLDIPSIVGRSGLQQYHVNGQLVGSGRHTTIDPDERLRLRRRLATVTKNLLRFIDKNPRYVAGFGLTVPRATRLVESYLDPDTGLPRLELFTAYEVPGTSATAELMGEADPGGIIHRWWHH